MGLIKAWLDRKFAKEFRADVFELWEMEAQGAAKIRQASHGSLFPRSPGEVHAAVAHASQDVDGYPRQRDTVARGALRADRLASRLGVPHVFTSYPAPAVGGAVIRQSVFAAILMDSSHGGVGHQRISDVMNQLVGEAESAFNSQRLRALNPINLLIDLLAYVLSLPFHILGAAGFNTDKIEDQLWARLFKLAFFFALAWLALNHFGFSKDDVVKIITGADK